MLRIGLTGGIGSGKTTVAKIFLALGIPVYFADDAAKRLMSADAELKKLIIQHFGEAAYQQGQPNRKFLAGIVFNDPKKLELLNSLVHPATIQDAERWIQQQTSPYIIKEAALLFESGADKHLDHIIGVYAPEDLRIKRVMERDGLSSEEIRKRIRRQMNEDEKMKRCDIIIHNNETEPVLPQVLKLHEKFMKADAVNH
jgi:dephospho-CoA kinase